MGYYRDWNGYMPDQVETEPGPIPQRRALHITPMDGEPFVITLEWDDGNGMWINAGVSL